VLLNAVGKIVRHARDTHVHSLFALDRPAQACGFENTP
jgi:hypothetical protein